MHRSVLSVIILFLIVLPVTSSLFAAPPPGSTPTPTVTLPPKETPYISTYPTAYPTSMTTSGPRPTGGPYPSTKPTPCATADLNKDSRVDMTDYGILIA